MTEAKKFRTPADPVFAMIEKHRKAYAEFIAALAPALPDGDPDPKLEKKFGERERKAADALAFTEPTTLAGAAALVAHVMGLHQGWTTSSGKPDEAFDKERLECILLGLHNFLQAQRLTRRCTLTTGPTRRACSHPHKIGPPWDATISTCETARASPLTKRALSSRTFERLAKRLPCPWRMPPVMVSADRMALSIS